MHKIFIALVVFSLALKASGRDEPAAFRWGNGYYYNLETGKPVQFNNLEVELLETDNHYNLLRVGEDTLWMKVARRSVPEEINGIRLFVADNKAIKSLNPASAVHGLLAGDALVCLSDASMPLLDPETYVFPVSFNNGYTWNAEEDSYMFSFYKINDAPKAYISYPGIGFNLNEARGKMMHWLVAVEDSRVVWINDKVDFEGGNQSCVLLESLSQPGIYYMYNGLFTNNVAVKKGQKLVRGEAIGTAWGNDRWGHLQFAVVHSATEPSLQSCEVNTLNGFPQVFSLYNQRGSFLLRSFSRGKIVFGGPRGLQGNVLNNLEFESYAGKGWITGRWNPAGKVEWTARGNEGNIRLKKVLFEGTPAECSNPDDYYEYQVSVRNGTYRIRAKAGDAFLESWQRLEFEGADAGTKDLDAGEYSWTGERIVKVNDGTLNVRIYVDPGNKRPAGLSEIVFQQAH